MPPKKRDQKSKQIFYVTNDRVDTSVLDIKNENEENQKNVRCFKCQLCPKKFYKKQSLGGHMGKVHKHGNVEQNRKQEVRNERTLQR